MRSILLLIACAACSRSESAPVVVGPTSHFCNLGVFTDAGLTHHRELTAKLAAAVTGNRELDTGYEVTFSGAFAEFGEWLDGDRLCCPTVHYDVDFSPMAGRATLRITGAGDAKTFIREEFAKILGPTHASARPVVLEFAADWCAACRVQEHRMATDPMLVAALGRFERVHVDVTTDDAPARRYAIAQLPTLIVLDAHGAPADRITGTAEPMQLAARLDADYNGLIP